MTPVFNPQPPTRLQKRTHQWMSVMARVKDGVTTAEAQAFYGRALPPDSRGGRSKSGRKGHCF
jgi:hypothetical protein